MNPKTKTVLFVAMFAFAGLFGLAVLPDAYVGTTQTAQGAYINGTWAGTYSDVMNATQDVFDLYGDVGTLLGQNVGNSLSATIQLFIYSVLVIMPFAVVFGIVITAIMLVKTKAKKMN